MPRARSPNSIKGEKMFINSNGKMELVEIAKQLEVSPGTVRSWKNRYKWDDKLNDNTNATLQKEKKKKRNVANKKKVEKPKHIEVANELDIENAELTERQRLFCLYYIRSFNATMSAIKAGYAKESAHVEGHRLLRNAKVAAEIRKLKGTMTQDIFIDAMDVLNKYIKIAFADITEYVKFGQREVPVMTMFGPMKDEDGNEVTKIVNYVDFNESTMVDGTIIKEVKQGKEGVSIKFEDKMKALDKLSLYFDLFPDKFKRKIEEEKIALAKIKAGENEEDGNIDDGFMEALKGTVKDVWEDEE
jgi:phage terminase small subunit